MWMPPRIFSHQSNFIKVHIFTAGHVETLVVLLESKDSLSAQSSLHANAPLDQELGFSRKVEEWNPVLCNALKDMCPSVPPHWHLDSMTDLASMQMSDPKQPSLFHNQDQ